VYKLFLVKARFLNRFWRSRILYMAEFSLVHVWELTSFAYLIKRFLNSKQAYFFLSVWRSRTLYMAEFSMVHVWELTSFACLIKKNFILKINNKIKLRLALLLFFLIQVSCLPYFTLFFYNLHPFPQWKMQI